MDGQPSSIYRSESGRDEVLRRYGDLLDRWSVPSEHLRLATREGETFVVASGPAEAPPVLLFHGGGTNSAIWLGDVPAWSEQFRVYAVDVIGEPGRSAPARPPLDSEAYALWLDDVLRELGIARTAVVGASLGGWLALDFATRRPDRVDRVAVLCPGGVGRQKFGWTPKAILLQPFGTWGARRTMRLVAGVDGSPRATATTTTTPSATPQNSEFLNYMTLIHRSSRPRRDRMPVFSDEALRRLVMPMLVIVGERDALLDSQETARRLAQNVPHASVTMLPGVAHSIAGQTRPILEFLRA
ncbi:alpha/beta hydrolase [Frankia sp. Cpl3]|nr:alpha/beta hydrolase [Frankia sp. Cpl3]